jgi:hypothetical protein
MNVPAKLKALGSQIRADLAQAFGDVRDASLKEVSVLEVVE